VAPVVVIGGVSVPVGGGAAGAVAVAGAASVVAGAASVAAGAGAVVADGPVVAAAVVAGGASWPPEPQPVATRAIASTATVRTIPGLLRAVQAGATVSR
jgi:hypothetical protein